MHLLEFLISGVVACHIRLVVLAVVQLHNLCTDDGFQGAASEQCRSCSCHVTVN